MRCVKTMYISICKSILAHLYPGFRHIYKNKRKTNVNVMKKSG